MDVELAALRKYVCVQPSERLYQDEQGRFIQFIILGDSIKLDMSFLYKTLQKLESEQSQNVQHVIFIYTLATLQTKKLKNYQNIIRIELFDAKELKRLLIGNRFISKHRQLPTEEADEVAKKFDKNNLPLIVNTDPMVKLYNFDLNSIIEIHRCDGIYYRVVVQE